MSSGTASGQDFQAAYQRDADQLFRAAFDGAPIGVCLLDQHGCFVKLNRALCDVLGYENDALLGTSLAMVTRPDHLPSAMELLASLSAADRNEGRLRTVMLGRDGKQIPAQVSLSVARRGEGGALYLIAHVEDLTEQLAAEANLRFEARHDALTGLPNRTFLADLLRSYESEGRSVGVMFLDLDNFKRVNDGFGHDLGDALLVSAARRLREVSRGNEAVVRFGGDEFLVVCADVDAEGAMSAAHRYRDAMREPFSVEGIDIELSASIGVVARGGGAALDTTSLIRDADTAMYRAKDLGRDAVVLFDEALREGLLKRIELEQALRRAVERREMHLAWQPFLDLHSGEVVGAEALCRWQREGRGMVSPVDFIPLAEATRLIVPIGRWVMETALLQARAWRRDVPRRFAGKRATTHLGSEARFHVAVNVSAHQLTTALPAQVESLLESTDASPGELCVELTESALFEDKSLALDVVKRLSSMGVRLAIDDFGTGYSSLAYLRDLPVHQLKIDRSFVSGLGARQSDASVVASIVSIAHELGLEVLAEGVETPAQLDALRAVGVDLVQGWLFSKAVPPDEIPAMVARYARDDEPG
ncbi:MAG: EAL domain-containing protein [Polyangiales bacterium]